MQRKLIQLSPSTSVISLPSKWIRKHNLVKGTPLELQENGTQITISPSIIEHQDQEITIDISKLKDRLLWITLDAAYISGYDSLIIHTKDQQQTKFLTTAVRYFPGMIIHEQRKNKVHFKDISRGAKGDISKILNRIFNLTIALLEEGIEALEKSDFKTLIEIKSLDYNINSYVSYCLRQLNKFGYEKPNKTGTLHSHIKVLEIMADRMCDMFIGLGKMKNNALKDQKKLHALVELYRKSHRLHFKFTQQRLIELEDLRQTLLCSLSKAEEHVKLYLTDIIELFFDLEQVEMQLHT